LSSAGVCSAPGRRDDAAGGDPHAAPVGGPGLDAARRAGLDDDRLDLRAHEQARAGVRGVLQPRLDRRALGAAPAAEAAAPAVDALVAGRPDVAHDRLDVEAELAHAALHDRVARAAALCSEFVPRRSMTAWELRS
jgi:hypothetical protein